jgi:hypothetical protein
MDPLIMPRVCDSLRFDYRYRALCRVLAEQSAIWGACLTGFSN